MAEDRKIELYKSAGSENISNPEQLFIFHFTREFISVIDGFKCEFSQVYAKNCNSEYRISNI